MIKLPFNINLAGLLAKPQSNSVGLDIGTSLIKMIVLEKKKEEKIIKKFSLKPIPPNSDIVDSLNSLIRSEGLEKNKINVSLSGPATIMRYINFPAMGIEELKSTMNFEAKEYIPFPLEEVILDCAILKEKTPDNKMLVLLAAVKKTAVQERLDLLSKAGLTPSVIDIDCLCLANVFYNSYPALLKEGKVTQSEVIGFLNIGSRFTNMAIIEDGILKFSRDIAMGGNDITKRIAEMKQLDFEKAETIKLDSEGVKEALTIIEPVLSNFAAEIRLSIDYYENQSGRTIDKIYISGGSAGLLNITDFLTHPLGIQIDKLDLLSGFNFDSGLEAQELKQKNLSFAIALGLALR